MSALYSKALGHGKDRAALHGAALAALPLPLAARLMWFNTIAKAMYATNFALGWNGESDQIN